jgi:methionyl-tRNA formyltransferase
LRFIPQPTEGVTYAHKVEKAQARIDWRRDAQALSCHLRAFDPDPGASSALARQADVPLRFFMPTVLGAPAADGAAAAAARPGEILAVEVDGVRIATGDGVLQVGQLQRPGGRRLAVAEFIRGHRLEPGDLLLNP